MLVLAIMAKASLRDLLVDKLSLLSDLESHVASVMPEMIDHAHHQMLKSLLREHLAETRNHVCRLEDALKLMRSRPLSVEVATVRALMDDADRTLEDVRDAHAFDAILASYAIWIEHIEIAAYGVASAWADMLGEARVHKLLGETLSEERSAKESLSKVMRVVGPKASNEASGLS